MTDSFLAYPYPVSGGSNLSLQRAVPAARVSRLRYSWFILGALTGSIVTSVISNSLLGYPAENLSKLVSSVTAPAVPDLAPLPMPAAPDLAAAEPAAPAPVPATVVAAPVAEAAMALPATLTIQIKSGDTLISLLTDKKVSYDEAHNLVRTMKKVYDPKRLSIGQSLTMTLDKDTDNADGVIVTKLSIPVSAIKTVHVVRSGAGEFKVSSAEQPLVKAMARAGGTITSSLYQTGVNSNIPAPLLGEIINAYSYDVDFQRDIKDGDRIDVLYERSQTETGIPAGHGDVIFASLTLGGKEKRIYRYASADGTIGWFNGVGESIRKALLRTPINGARITSAFGMRKHPILGYSKMHRGVDFGAPTGTPIYAAGDGTVAEAGMKGSYGKYVRIKHDGKYSTAYAHASRIASGVKPGAKVKQGQIIAYVGTTGRSTGAHLHYEILEGNKQVNPSGVKFKTGQSIGRKEMARFKKQVDYVKMALDRVPLNAAVAYADTSVKAQ